MPFPQPLRRPRALQRPDAPRVVAVFGAPGAGVTSALAVIRDASSTPLVITRTAEEAEEAILKGARVVFIDGLPQTGEDVQDIYDRGLISPGIGAFVRLWVDEGEVDARVAEPIAPERRKKHRDSILGIEERIFSLGLPYFTIPNGAMLTTVTHLVRHAGLRE